MTPLYDAIRAYAAQKPTRFHMPGHKGNFLPVPELQSIAPLDVTEVEPTGDLFSGGEPFDTAQKLWAERFGMDNCLFLTGGWDFTPPCPCSAVPATRCSSTGDATGRCTTPWLCWT